MKKIGLYLDSVITGGTFQYNLTVLEAILFLPSKEFNTVIAYTSKLWESYLQKENISAIKINRTILSRLWFQIRTPLWFWRNTSKYFDSFSKSFINQKCDLWIFPSQDIWSYSLPIPALGTVHDLMHRYEKTFPEVSSKKMFKKRELHYSRISKYSKAILVDSKIGKGQMIESYNTKKNKIYILRYIPPQYIYNEKAVDIYKIYDIPKKFFFYPAQFWSHKNHMSLIKATVVVQKQYPDIQFVFVGSKKGGYESTIHAINKYDMSKHITILDYVPDDHIPEFYKSARAMIMPTFFGPTNIPPLEAMALGCPVAVSNIYAMPEQIGSAGLLFNPNSLDDIVNVMKKLWIDDKLVNELRQKGYERSSGWQQSQFNTKFANILNQILGIN